MSSVRNYRCNAPFICNPTAECVGGGGSRARARQRENPDTPLFTVQNDVITMPTELSSESRGDLGRGLDIVVISRVVETGHALAQICNDTRDRGA